MSMIINKLRDIVVDNFKMTTDVFEYFTSKIFSLTESNVDSTSIVCYKNGVSFTSSNYTYSTTTGRITVTGTLVTGDELEFIYKAYEKYSDAELSGYIRAALAELSVERYKTFIVREDNLIFPTPTESEEYLIAVIAGIIIKGNILSYKTPEISITFNNKQTKEEKIKMTVRQFKKSLGVIKYIDLEGIDTLPKEDQDGL